LIDRAAWAKRELAYEFFDPSLLEQALTHRSASKDNNERLEFLGDAMLGLVIAKTLYRLRPDANEGDLSRARASLVKKETLAGVGRQIDIDKQLVLGTGELRTGGAQRSSALADAVEAIIGAVVLDGGYDAGEQLIARLFAEPLARLPDSDSLKDPKTRLQEWLQARGLGLPDYSVDDVSGSDHNQHFAVVCRIDAKSKVSTGRGSSRRRAEQAAAEAMLVELQGGDG
jgi:ribonuclease-3